MASTNRSAQFARIAKILKKHHYEVVKPDPLRPVFEHLLFACCLENAHYEPAEETYAALKHTFFDFNEIRVTSISELSEVMAALPDPRAAANRFKRVLQAVFESTYCFDLEECRKKNLGPTVKWLQKLDGSTPFVVAYVVQSALGGHAIPVDSGVLRVLHVVELINDKDLKAVTVPGMERAVAKSKGIEFGAMLHQLGADFVANPYSPNVREILLEINPDCKDRLPKRRARKKEKETLAAEPATADPSSAKGKKAPKADEKKADSAAKKKPAASRKKSPAKDKTTSEGLSKRKPR